MAKEVSALDGYCKKGVFGKQDNPTIVLSEIKQTIIYQFAGWSNNLLDVGDKFAESVKIKNFPKKGLIMLKNYWKNMLNQAMAMDYLMKKLMLWTQLLY